MYSQTNAPMAPPQKPETFMLSESAQQSLPQDAQVALQQVDNREYTRTQWTGGAVWAAITSAWENPTTGRPCADHGTSQSNTSSSRPRWIGYPINTFGDSCCPRANMSRVSCGKMGCPDAGTGVRTNIAGER